MTKWYKKPEAECSKEVANKHPTAQEKVNRAQLHFFSKSMKLQLCLIRIVFDTVGKLSYWALSMYLCVCE